MFGQSDNPDSENGLDAARDLLRLGVVQSVDLAAARCVVDLGDDLITGPIPWTAARAGATKIWSPPAEGEQVLVFAPEGDLERAIAGGAIFSNAFGPPASDGRTHIEFPDGAHVAYDPASGLLEIEVVNQVRIAAPGGISIEGDVEIQGDLKVVGKIEATGDVKADTVSLQNHVHTATATAAPTSLSGKPKP
ncbi:MAG: phage baseplate assembly protein V [Caulobacteraceae bacterium]|nr:phage baseplate assembly protein V [Caulobacteraceae bacterium]